MKGTNENAIYFLAQYSADPMRREPRNVGVVVADACEAAWRFVGEADDGRIDGRSLRWTEHADVYRKWVDYWREMIAEVKDFSADSLTRELTAENGGNYNLVPSGEISEAGDTALEQICDDLYRMLVVHRDEAKEEADRVRDIAVTRVRTAVRNEFSKRGILAPSRPDLPYPVYHLTTIQGKGTSHVPGYVQQNGTLCVMEATDFTIKRKGPAADHAGLMAAMFADIAAARDDRTVESVAIIQARPDDLENKRVKYSLSLLKDVAHARVVNWLNPEEREAFADERQRVATTRHANSS